MYCFKSEIDARMLSIAVSNKCQFVSFLYNNYLLDVYNLSIKRKIKKNGCGCVKEIMEPGKIKRTIGFFGGVFNKVKVLNY